VPDAIKGLLNLTAIASTAVAIVSAFQFASTGNTRQWGWVAGGSLLALLIDKLTDEPRR
jgi:hypothetical protein